MNWLRNLSLLFILVAANGCAVTELISSKYKIEQLHNEGRYQEALSLAQQSVTLAKKTMGPETIPTANALNHLAVVYCVMGDYDKGMPLFEQSLRMMEKLNGQDSVFVVGLTANMAVFYIVMGAYDKALPLLERTLRFLENGSFVTAMVVQDFFLPHVLMLFGTIYEDMGYYDKALPFYERSQKIFEKVIGPEHFKTASILTSLAMFYVAMESYDKALPLYERALSIYEKTQGPEGPFTVVILASIGRLYLEMKDYSKAETYIMKSKEKKGMVDLYLATGKYHEALQLLQEIPAKVTDPPHNQVQFYIQKGTALAATGQRLEAEESFLQAVQAIEEMRTRVTGDKEGFLSGKGGHLRAYRGLYSTLAESSRYNEKLPEGLKPYGDTPASAGFYFAEATKARSLLEAMTETAQRKTHAGIPKELQQKEENLLNQLGTLNDQWEKAYKSGKDALEEVRNRKEKLAGELASLITELRKSYPVYVALHYPRPVPAKELPLKTQEVLLEYAVGEKSSALFLVRKGGVEKVIPIAIGKEALEEKVKSFMDPFLNKQGEGFSVVAAKELYDLLLANALAGVKQTDEVVIIPDGILGLLPFEVLIDKQGKGANNSSYVGDHYSIRYYQSATVMALQRTMKQQSASKVLFALGNPVFSTDDTRYTAFRSGQKSTTTVASNTSGTAYRALATNRGWGKTTRNDKDANDLVYPSLPETEDEVRSIAKLFDVKVSPPDILLNLDASATRLKEVTLKDYRYVHFATHADLPGHVQGVNEPFILLGQVDNAKEEDGFLTMSKVLGLNLNADMVVLSACLTGRGKVMEGEGVANFARAFQHAGAKSVLVSLWEVSSNETVEYMEKFYGHLKAGKTRSEALRLARNEIKSRYPNPFIWAPFILHGEG